MTKRKERLIHLFALVALVANLFAPVFTLPVLAEDLNTNDPVVTTQTETDEAEAQRLADEEAKKKAAEEEAARLKAEEDAAATKAAEDAAATQAAEDEAARIKAEEEAAKQKSNLEQAKEPTSVAPLAPTAVDNSAVCPEDGTGYKQLIQKADGPAGIDYTVSEPSEEGVVTVTATLQ